MKTMYQKLLFLLLMLPLGMLAQSTVSGTVRDNATGEPLPGVNVIVEGTTNGTATDMDGNYTLSNVKQGDRLVFSFIGYANQTVEYTGGAVNVSLSEDAQQLGEVVVVGYGSVRRSDATGSITTVSSREFNRGANVTAENLIQGRVAGVTLNQTGQPGSGATIRIRGGSSLNASNDPLIVIDGLPITNTNAGGASSILASINPNDIESFNILKDASATAIYGSRASNGVIIITTKKGGKELAVDYNFQYGSGKAASKIDVFSADEFRQYVAQHRPAAEQALLGTANTDWQDEIYRRTDLVDNNVNIRGSLFNTIPTRLSVGNTYQEGLRLTNTFNRTTTALAMNPTFFDNHLKINFNGNYSRERNRYAGSQEGAAIRFDPTQPVYDANSRYGGFFEYHNNDADQTLIGQTARNPVAALLQRRDISTGNRFYGNFQVDYSFHFLPELRAVVNLGFDQSRFEGSNTASSDAATSVVQNDLPLGSNSSYWSYRKNKLLDAYLVYKKTIGKLDFDVTGGYSYQKFDTQDFTTNETIGPSVVGPETTIGADVVLTAFFGRANISWDNKYLLTLTGRNDYTSRVREHGGFFPGAAFAWKIKEESFLKDSKTFSDLKLRTSYGITGQQDIGSAGYIYLATTTLGNPASIIYFGNTPVVIGLPNYQNDIVWEKTAQFDAGLDFGFLNNRLAGAVDVFYKESRDLLTSGPVADGSNFGNQGYQNVGRFTTKGIEFTVNATVIDSEDMRWNVNFNATHFQRKVTELLNHTNIETIGGVAGGTGVFGQVYSEGWNPSSFFVYKQLYDASGAPVQGAYADLNGDGVINGSDRYIFRNADPKVTMGFSSNFNWKGFDLFFNLRASIGNRLLNNVNSNFAQWSKLQDQSVLGNIPTAVMDSNFTTSTTESLVSDYYIEDASFLRMDNITLGYTFNKWLSEKGSVRVYTGMQNVFVITNYSGLDPEVSTGVDNTIYPRPRTFLVGANFKF